MSKQVAIAGLVVSILSAVTMFLLSRPIDQVIWLAAAWVLGAAASLIVGATQVKHHRRLGWFCLLGGIVMLFFAAMLLPAFQRAKGHRQQPVANLMFRPPNLTVELMAAGGHYSQVRASWAAAIAHFFR